MGAARLLAKGWIAFCLYAGALATARAFLHGLPSLPAFRQIALCIFLFGAMGILFISGYGLSSGHARPLLRVKPTHFVPGFNELVFIAFAIVSLLAQIILLPSGGPAVAALEAALRFAVFGQRAVEGALVRCDLDGARRFASACSWMLALVFLASALSRIRLAAGIVRLERKTRPEALGAQPLALVLGLTAVVGIQLLFVGTGFALMPCRLLGGVGGGVVIGLGPLALAYLIVAALINLLAIGQEA